MPLKIGGNIIIQKTVQKNTDNGTGSVDEFTTLEKWDNGNYSNVNYDDEVITVIPKGIMDIPITYTYPDVTRYRYNLSTLQTLWTEELLGRTCLNRQMNDQQNYPTFATWCVFNDKLILKEVDDGSSYRHYVTTTATEIKFDLELSDALFKLPDFPEAM